VIEKVMTSPASSDPEIIKLREFNVDTAVNLKWLLFNDHKEKYAKW
jgi:hypothetical protein